MAERNYLVISTIDSRETAEAISRTLVEERLAACVNIVPDLTSIYEWKGNLEQTSELLMLLKTTAERLPRLTRRLDELHPYEVPEIVALPIETGHPPYLEWVAEQTAPSK